VARYDFKGIREKGAAGVMAALATVPQVAIWFAKFPVLKGILSFALEAVINLAANFGLLVLNVGTFTVGGKIDQLKFDAVFEEALRKVKYPGLTKAQKDAIDADVIKAFRQIGLVTRYGNSVQGDDSDLGLRNHDPASRI
jgi:hypothetical protein